MESIRRRSAEEELVAKIEHGALKGKEALVKLAETQKFVYHGSTVRIPELEPRQSYNNKESDGEPSISAAPDEGYELAIFMSLIRSGESRTDRPRGGRTSGFATSGAKDGRWDFTANKLAFEDATDPDARGYVHVFRKKDFQQYQDRTYEWRAYKNIKPLLVVTVTAEDLPHGIKVTDEGE